VRGILRCASRTGMFSTPHISVKAFIGPLVYPCPMREHRPWGNFTVLDEGENYKVKRIEVLAGKRLSYQKHSSRSEHWMIVAGTAKVTLDGHESTIATGGTIDVPIGAAHRIENVDAGVLVFIEIQRGTYLGEDDIQRLQDDFGRVTDSAL
jgi:mannose-6-phosphate isomerase